MLIFFFFFNDTATTEIYTLSLHDALPIWNDPTHVKPLPPELMKAVAEMLGFVRRDRKSTRLNSSHQIISYAVFCLKKKKKKKLSCIDTHPNDLAAATAGPLYVNSVLGNYT